MEKFVPFHQHMIVKCWVLNPPKDVDVLNKWLIDLVHAVDMKVVAGPTSVYVADPGNEGLTGTITLATSHASIHIWDSIELPLIQFDLYSCKPYDSQIIIDHLNQWNLHSYNWIMLDRNDNIKVIEENYKTL